MTMMGKSMKKPDGGAKPLSAGQLRKIRGKRQQLLRAFIQLIFFIMMPSAFVAGFSGVKYIFTQIGTGQVLSLTGFLMTLTGLCGFTILFGRFFCGYICAFGALGDAVYALSAFVQKKIFHKKKPYEMPVKAVRLLQKLKYVLLVEIIFSCVLGMTEAFTGTSPWDVFSRVTAGKLNFSGYGIGVILMLLLLIGMALQERFFCQVFCPMGAVFALLPVMPWAVLKRERESCGKGCSLCSSKCPVHVELDLDNPAAGECIRCGKCAVGCPKENIHSLNTAVTGSEWWIVAGKAVLFFAMGVLLGLCR